MDSPLYDSTWVIPPPKDFSESRIAASTNASANFPFPSLPRDVCKPALGSASSNSGDREDLSAEMASLPRVVGRDVIGGEIARGGMGVPYLRDVHDHVLRLLDLLENQRELAAALMELHLTTVSHRLNEIMKVLTIMGTIFIPLTFLAGVYGMNFRYLPELEWHHGYAAFWIVCLFTASTVIAWFRRKGWL